MSDDIAALGIAVDSTQAVSAASNLDKLTASSAAAEAATVKLGSAASSYQVLQEKIAAALAAQGLALEDYAGASVTYAGKTIASFEAQATAAQVAGQITQKEAQATAAAKAAEAAAYLGANDLEIASDVKRGLSARQIREIISATRFSIEGDFTRAAGSASVLAQTMGSGILPILGWAAAFAAALAPMGLVIIGAIKGQEEIAKLDNAITATGNYAGTTTDQLHALAEGVATQQNQSIGSVKASLATLVSSGEYSIATIKSMTTAAAEQSQITGVAMDKVVASYAQAKGGVVEFAVKHEESFHDITLAQIDYINQLEKSGEHEKAEKQFFDDISDSLKNRAAPAYGILQEAMHQVALGASEMWDKILGVGRGPSLDEKIKGDAAKIQDVAHMIQVLAQHPVDNISQINALKNVMQQTVSEMRGEQASGVGSALAASGTSALAQANDDAIRKKYDNKSKGPKPKQPKEDNTERYEDDTDKINAQSDALEKMASAYGDGAYAALQAKAASDAETAALVASQGPHGQVIIQADVEARTRANLNKAVYESIDASAKLTNATNQRAIAQTQINALVATGRITEADATRQVQQSVEQQKLLDIALNGTAVQAIQASIALELLVRAQKDLNTADDAASARKFNQARQSLPPDVAAREGAGAGQNQNSATAEATKTANAVIAIEQANYKTRLAARQAYTNQLDAMILRDDITQRQAIVSLAQFDLATQKAKLKNTSDVLDAIALFSSSKSNEIKEIAKAAAIASATINMYQAISGAYAAFPYWPANAANVITVGIQSAANIASIAGLAGGGPVSGDGGPRDDTHIRRLSAGEYVINAEATARNRPLLDQINTGGRKMASGGPVSQPGYVPSSPSGGTVMHVDFTGANFGGADPDVIMQRVDMAMRKVYGPAIMVKSVSKSVQTTNTQAARQKLNGRNGRTR